MQLQGWCGHTAPWCLDKHTFRKVQIVLHGTALLLLVCPQTGYHQCMCIQQTLLTHSRDLQNCDIHCVGVCRFSPRVKVTHVGMLAQATNTLMQFVAYQYIWVLQQPQPRLHTFCVLRRNICARICAGSLDMLMSTRSVHVYTVPYSQWGSPSNMLHSPFCHRAWHEKMENKGNPHRKLGSIPAHSPYLLCCLATGTIKPVTWCDFTFGCHRFQPITDVYLNPHCAQAKQLILD